MSVEFIRGPNVYLRETTAADLDNIKDTLVDWNWFPFSLDEITITYNAALPALRGGGLMNEAAKLRDAALFTELNVASYTNRLDPSFITNLRPYHTLEGTELSQRSNRTLKLVKATKDDYDTWAAANSSSIPAYTFSGGSYTPPQDR